MKEYADACNPVKGKSQAPLDRYGGLLVLVALLVLVVGGAFGYVSFGDNPLAKSAFNLLLPVGGAVLAHIASKYKD